MDGHGYGGQDGAIMSFRGKDRPPHRPRDGSKSKPGATHEQIERRERFQRAQRESLQPAEALKGACDVADIGERLKAGTNCGACKPEIGKLLRGAAVRDSQSA